MAATRKAHELDEIRGSLNFMSEEIAKVASQQQSLMGLMKEIQQLKELVIQKDRKIEELEQRVDVLEQQTRSQDIIISGLETKHRSYSKVAAGADLGVDAPTEELQSLEQQVLLFFNSKNINMDKINISTCYTFPNKDRRMKPSIGMRLVSQKQKIDLLRQSRKLKGTGVYINEHLTKKNAEIAKCGRLLRKQNKIQATWTRNGKVYIRPNGEESRSVMIGNLHELDKYK